MKKYPYEQKNLKTAAPSLIEQFVNSLDRESEQKFMALAKRGLLQKTVQRIEQIEDEWSCEKEEEKEEKEMLK